MLKTEKKLTPEDFTSQLYISLNDGMSHLTVRHPVAYGQKEAGPVPVIRDGLTLGFSIHDREEGGEPVLVGTVDPVVVVFRGDNASIKLLCWGVAL